jgi:hypothetical protein
MRGRKLDAALGEIVQDDLADREPVMLGIKVDCPSRL